MFVQNMDPIHPVNVDIFNWISENYLDGYPDVPNFTAIVDQTSLKYPDFYP